MNDEIKQGILANLASYLQESDIEGTAEGIRILPKIDPKDDEFEGAIVLFNIDGQAMTVSVDEDGDFEGTVYETDSEEDAIEADEADDEEKSKKEKDIDVDSDIEMSKKTKEKSAEPDEDKTEVESDKEKSMDKMAKMQSMCDKVKAMHQECKSMHKDISKMYKKSMLKLNKPENTKEKALGTEVPTGFFI
jgi:hypothetical protein